MRTDVDRERRRFKLLELRMASNSQELGLSKWQTLISTRRLLMQVDLAGIENFFRESCGWYAQRWPDRWRDRQKSGRWWAWVQTRAKFKRPDDERMPSRFWELPPVTSGFETSGWLKSQLIRFAKSKRNTQERQHVA
jgi:hypothetical protein